MVMSDRISRLMDGELEESERKFAWTELERADGMATWACYHVIGDTLRGTDGPVRNFAGRFGALLRTEPTVLAPGHKRSRPLPFVWAAAASVAAVALTGWVAFGTLDPAATAVAKSREAGGVRAAQVRPQPVPADYLLAHQEYSPSTQSLGVEPNFRAATVAAGDATR
jgi:sigma-E factor negative regulatory protein RseA